jgi:hypothetical protein
MKNTLTTVQEYLRPLDVKGRSLIGTSLFFAVLIYLYRAQSDEFWMMGYGAAFIFIFSFPLLLVLFLWFIVHPFLVIWYVIKAKTLQFAVALPTLLIVLAFIFPVPQLREYSLYLSHQEEYMTLVRLAQSGLLSHNNSCKGAFAPPKGYEKLTGDCIFVDEKGGIIEFTPYTFYVALSYAEVPGNISNSSWCNWDGFIWEEINPHWYICKRDFN